MHEVFATSTVTIMSSTMTVPARLLLCCLGGLTVLVSLASCSMAAGDAATDREAETMVNRLSFPRQESADGLVRAARGTSAGTMSGNSVVVEAEELHADKTEDPFARLVFRFHHDGSQSGFNSSDPVTACYEAEFSFYGVIGQVHRTSCPEGAKEIVPTPIPPTAKAVIPAGFDAMLKKVLETLPAAPAAVEVKALVARALPAPVLDPESGLRNLPPAFDTAVEGADVGISLRGFSNEDCLLGARVAGKVIAGRPSRIQMQPGELTCDPQTALQLPGIRPPH
jgi:hypothetical protein